MNILRLTYHSQIETYNLIVNVADASVSMSNSFFSKFCPHFAKKEKKFNIVFFTKNFTTEPCSGFVITIYIYYELRDYIT